MLFKDVAESVKDVDTVKGIVTGYFSKFGNKDSDGDIILPGAFKKTLQENGPESSRPRILHLYQHDPWKPIGKPKVLKEDSEGLYFESEISQTSIGKDVIQLYVDGVLTEHSIGFQIVKREVDETANIQKLIELKLWEGSTVSWGANMEALVTGVKSTDKAGIQKVIDKLDAVTKAFTHGSFTDETHRALEIQMKQLQQLIISLVTAEPETLREEKAEITAQEIVSKLKLNIKNL